METGVGRHRRAPLFDGRVSMVHYGSVIRQRMLRLKKRKSVLRRQRSLREKMLFAKDEFEDQLTDNLELVDQNESAKGKDR